MKILFTGGGTGGHFYPIIAIADEIRALANSYKLVDIELYYMSDTPYNEGELYEHGITFKKTSAGKLRVYFSLLNITDLIKTAWGVLTSLIEIFRLYPDVIFGKGGYASFPALLAGRILGIPVVIHESDSVPGRVNAWAGKFAKRIAISYPSASQYFPAGKTAYTGNPIRKDIALALSNGAHEYLELDPTIPTILVLGGSQGALKINEIILQALPELLTYCQVIHQTGKAHFKTVTQTADVVLHGTNLSKRYKPMEYLNPLTLRMSAGASSIVVSRAGSTLFEIASWGVPAIIIPITNSNGDHQRMNAYAYARTGAGIVIEEKNLSPHIIVSEVKRLLDHPEERERMIKATEQSRHPQAALKIATEILNIALQHEQ